MEILVHACCAHCLGKTLSGLRNEFRKELQPTAHWYNPNIHPLIEYRRRLKAVLMYLERDRIPSVIDNDYGLFEFCRLTASNQLVPKRCGVCYDMRLGKAAETARNNGIPFFTTTLVTSKHQSHELIVNSGKKAAEKYGVEFLYRDLRDAQANEKLMKGLYSQQYCGCVFSEYDRYKDTSKHVYKG